jgi:hypothetical protein
MEFEKGVQICEFFGGRRGMHGFLEAVKGSFRHFFVMQQFEQPVEDGLYPADGHVLCHVRLLFSLQ